MEVNLFEVRLFEVLQQLVKKLEDIEGHPSYLGVWTMASVHGFKYDGPTYDKELLAACHVIREYKNRNEK